MTIDYETRKLYYRHTHMLTYCFVHCNRQLKWLVLRWNMHFCLNLQANVAKIWMKTHQWVQSIQYESGQKNAAFMVVVIGKLDKIHFMNGLCWYFFFCRYEPIFSFLFMFLTYAHFLLLFLFLYGRLVTP